MVVEAQEAAAEALAMVAVMAAVEGGRETVVAMVHPLVVLEVVASQAEVAKALGVEAKAEGVARARAVVMEVMVAMGCSA